MLTFVARHAHNRLVVPFAVLHTRAVFVVFSILVVH